MLISHKRRFIFVHIPKTGGQSIENALCRSVDDIQQMLSSHATISELKAWECPKYQVFAWVRDPWDRMLSIYAYYVRRKRQPTRAEFMEFLAHPPADAQWMMREQVDYITGRRVEVGRFETIERDFKEMCRLIGLPDDTELWHLNSTDSTSLRDYYDKWAVWRVRELFPRDVEQFGYITPDRPEGLALLPQSG